jgi:hypothetical protein
MRDVRCTAAQMTAFRFTWCHARVMWSAREPAIAAYSWMRALRRELSQARHTWLGAMSPPR